LFVDNLTKSEFPILPVRVFFETYSCCFFAEYDAVDGVAGGGEEVDTLVALLLRLITRASVKQRGVWRANARPSAHRRDAHGTDAWFQALRAIL
jgi:hypothetical protein